jgi:Ca2+-binding RTX toxin-like protein
MPATNGNDLLIGNANPNNIEGLGGDDEIYGRGGNDFLDGDSVGGATGDDEIYGEGGDDDLFGRDGNDELRGGQGEDYLDGWGGNDELYGGKHDDHLTGLSGNDWLVGGEGDDSMFGGTGADTFVFEKISDCIPFGDVIGDLFDDVDKIDVSGIDAKPGVGGNQAFVLVGGSFTQPGQLMVAQAASSTYVYLNTDADVAAEGAFEIDGLPLLNNSDFVL